MLIVQFWSVPLQKWMRGFSCTFEEAIDLHWHYGEVREYRIVDEKGNVVRF